MARNKDNINTSNEILETKIAEPTSIFSKNKKTVKGLIAPGGIDASYTNHLEIQQIGSLHRSPLL